MAAPAGDHHRQGARALTRTFWHEDPIKMDSLGDLKRYADASPAPICASETLGTRWAFRDLLETGAAGVVMLDIAWCGGLSEARKIAAMAEAWHLPVAPHDCTGPVVLAASTHLSLNAPNALVQESVRAYLSDLVSRSGDRGAGSEGWLHHGAAGAGARPRARAGPRQTFTAQRPHLAARMSAGCAAKEVVLNQGRK